MWRAKRKDVQKLNVKVSVEFEEVTDLTLCHYSIYRRDPLKHFHAHFEGYRFRNFMNIAKFEKKVFCPSQNSVNVQNVRLKQICRINSDIANIQLTWLISCFCCLQKHVCKQQARVDWDQTILWPQQLQFAPSKVMPGDLSPFCQLFCLPLAFCLLLA